MEQQFDLLELIKTIAQPLPDSLYDNGLNVRCKKCHCWVSKRIFTKVLEDGLCPDCRREEMERVQNKTF